MYTRDKIGFLNEENVRIYNKVLEDKLKKRVNKSRLPVIRENKVKNYKRVIN